MAGRGRKPWELNDDESLTSFQNWQSTTLYNISLDPNWSAFLPPEGVHHTWNKYSSANKLRGLTDDTAPIAEDKRKTAVQKNTHLELMLGYIAGFAPVLSRNSIVKNSVSLSDIWQQLRAYYGFASTGAQFLDLAGIRFLPNERPEKLYQRLRSFFEDNMLTSTCGVTHHSAAVTVDEEMTPTVENTITFLWLQLIHPGLPSLVKQKYGAELRNKSLASIKPEVSLAMSSLREELNTIEESQINRAGPTFYPRKFNSKPTKSCILCKTAKRAYQHDLHECRFLPENDRRRMARSRAVEIEQDDRASSPEPDPQDYDADAYSVQSALIDKSTARRVAIIPSPTLLVYYGSHAIMLTLDTGATTTMINEAVAHRAGLPIKAATQTARQADGRTPLTVVGEIHCQVNRGKHSFQLSGLVVKELDSEVLAGTPFLVSNDIATRPARNQIVIKGTEIIPYNKNQTYHKDATVSRVDSFLCRNGNKQTILPGDYIDVPGPSEEGVWTVEPRFDSTTNQHSKAELCWPAPQLIQSVGGNIRLTNTQDAPIVIGRAEHICQLSPVSEIMTPSLLSSMSQAEISPVVCSTSPNTPRHRPQAPFSHQVSLDPQKMLSISERTAFEKLLLQYDSVFNPAISMYNGRSGKIEAKVNMGPVLPPQRKGRLPQYNKSTLSELQNKFDELEDQGVFTTPEQAGVTVEYLNISFLVKKSNGGHRLVTSFGEVGSYSKPQPSLMPNVDQVLRDIASWQFIIVTDLLQSFYQLPLSKDSMKFCGVVTPFKGIRVYTRSAMGMPGSETTLEELMSRVLGNLIQQGRVVKLADDLYCGGSTPQEALHNFELVLAALQHNNLRLSAKKTIICPKSTVILGWIWSNGTLQASPHRVNALAAVDPPRTVRSLRSFIGAYKVLSRVLPSYAYHLHPLEQTVAGRGSSEQITWNDDLLDSFNSAKQSLQDNKIITLPQPSDILWIVTDGAVRPAAIGATLYILRPHDKLHLGGFFNAKLKKHQISWLPCEVEALSIAIAIKHFAPYLVQSNNVPQVLTDSKACVEGYQKLKRGEFSNSSRVATFLTMVSRYQINVRHIKGESNLPSDFASRHPLTCPDSTCQLCKFIATTEESVVQAITVKDVLDGTFRMPFTSRAAWRDTQLECPDLRRAHAHLTQGTRPSRKTMHIRDTRRYLAKITVANDGLLVHLDESPFVRVRERIVIPRSALSGLLTALHIKFNHPSQNQLRLLFTRYFFALDAEKTCSEVSETCAQCHSLKSFPTSFIPQTSEPPPSQIGVSFAADVLRRHKQFILVLRETVSSFTKCLLINSERHDDLKDGLLILVTQFTAPDSTKMTIRVDSCPAFKKIAAENTLQPYGITLVLGQEKNCNKNPVAERAVQEISSEILKVSTESGPVSMVHLSLATARLNSRVRECGLSAQEVWTQRDQHTGSQLPLCDNDLITAQHTRRQNNHGPSSTSKARGHPVLQEPLLEVGQLVLLKSERDKSRPRDKYIVTAIDHDVSTCQIRKFTHSQFRAKQYVAKLCDCFPIKTTVQAEPNRVRPILSDTSDSSDYDPDPPIPTAPPPPPAIVDAPMAIGPAPARAKRDTRAPSWLSGDDWIRE